VDAHSVELDEVLIGLLLLALLVERPRLGDSRWGSGLLIDAPSASFFSHFPYAWDEGGRCLV